MRARASVETSLGPGAVPTAVRLAEARLANFREFGVRLKEVGGP